MPSLTQAIAPPVAAVLDRVLIDPGLASARVDGEPVEVDDPYHLRRELAATVYSVLHVGTGADQADMPYHTRDQALEEELASAVAHECVENRYPVVTVADDTVVIARDGVRVRVARDSVLDEPVAGGTARVRVRPYRPLLSPGFFFVNGSRETRSNEPILRLYAHLTGPRDAVAFWRRLLPLLEEVEPRYRTKVLSAPSFYPRRDALVVYLTGEAAGAAGDIVARLEGSPELAPGTSAFTQEVAPGLATAWEPIDPRKEFRGLSFGQHRAYVVVDALIEAAAEGTAIEEALERACAEAHVDPTDLSRNRVPSPTS
jgi:hypothetical protein